MKEKNTNKFIDNFLEKYKLSAVAATIMVLILAVVLLRNSLGTLAGMRHKPVYFTDVTADTADDIYINVTKIYYPLYIEKNMLRTTGYYAVVSDGEYYLLAYISPSIWREYDLDTSFKRSHEGEYIDVQIRLEGGNDTDSGYINIGYNYYNEYISCKDSNVDSPCFMPFMLDAFSNERKDKCILELISGIIFSLIFILILVNRFGRKKGNNKLNVLSLY